MFSPNKNKEIDSPTSPALNKPKPTPSTRTFANQAFGLNNNVSKREFVRFLIYVILLFIIINNNLDVVNSYDQNTYFVSILSTSGSLSLLTPTYTPDLQTAFNTTIYNILRYNENNFVPVPDSVSPNLTFNNSLLLKTITDLRITQTRVQTESSTSIVWKNPIQFLTDSYGSNNSFLYEESQKGFACFLPLFTTNSTSNISTVQQGINQWENTLNMGYFDARTYSLKIDFAYISNCLDIMTYMIILSEILPSGVAKTTVEVRTFNFGFFGSDETSERWAVNVLYYLLCAYYFIVMFIKIYYDIKHVEIDDEVLGIGQTKDTERVTSQIDTEKWGKSTTKLKMRALERHQTGIMNKFQMPKRFLLRFFIGLKRHCSQTNNLIDLFVNIMNVLILTITFEVRTMKDLFQDYENIANMADDPRFQMRDQSLKEVKLLQDMNNQIDNLSLQMNNYQMYCAMIALVQCFKILSYFISFSSSLQRFFTIISNILDVLFFYLLLIVVIFMSFVLLVRNFYGYQIPEFTNIYATSVYLFGMISGYNEYLTTMWNKSPEFTLFFHIAYNFIIVFILMNMFLVIVKNEFSRFQTEIKKKNEASNDGGLSRFQYKPSFVYLIKDKIESWYMTSLFYFKKSLYYNKKSIQKEKELHMLNDVNLYNHIDFDVNFVDMLKNYQNLQAKNSMVEAEKARINVNKKKESVKSIWQLFFLMISLGLYIFLVTQFFQTEENYNLASSVVQTLHKPYSNPRVIDGTIDATTLSNLNDVLYYMIYLLPSSFSSKYYYKNESGSADVNQSLIKENPSFNEFMFLVNRKIRMTVRKTKKVANTNSFKSVSPDIISPAFSYDATDSGDEYTEDSPYSNYSREESYAAKGGYVNFLNLTNMSNEIIYLNQVGFFDETLNSITLDFVLANVIKNKFIYCLMVFQFGNTGDVDVIDLVLPFRRINFSSVLDICITILLLLIIFIYFIYIFKFVKAVHFKAESYQTWYSMFIKHTIPKSLLFHRERKQPEIFRKIAYVFDFKSVLNILFFLFTGVFIILMILLQVSVLEIENKANIFETDLAEIMKYITWRLFPNPGENQSAGSYLNLSVSLMAMLDMIALFAALSAFVLVFQILYFYSKKNSFYVIIHSILVSLKEIPFMIAVLLSFLFTFAMYGFLLLGKLHPKYHTFPTAVRTLFEYLSHIDDIDFFMQEDSMLGFFTLLVPYFLSVKLVIINMFFSIIYRAYEKSKIEGEKQEKEEINLSFKDFWIITYKLLTRNLEEKDNTLELYSQMLHKTDIEDLFLKMKETIRISNQNTNIHIWANICSEEIRNEYEKRNFLKEKCDEIMRNYFFKNSSGDKYFRLLGRNLNKKCVEYELRKNYWDYFRIAHQYLNRYDFYFRNRITELNDRLKNREEIEKQKEEENAAYKKYIADLMKRLEDNKRDIAEVKEQIRKLKIDKEIEDAREKISREISIRNEENKEDDEEENIRLKAERLRKAEELEGKEDSGRKKGKKKNMIEEEDNENNQI